MNQKGEIKQKEMKKQINTPKKSGVEDLYCSKKRVCFDLLYLDHTVAVGGGRGGGGSGGGFC